MANRIWASSCGPHVRAQPDDRRCVGQMRLEGAGRLVHQRHPVGQERHALDPAGPHQQIDQRDHGAGFPEPVAITKSAFLGLHPLSYLHRHAELNGPPIFGTMRKAVVIAVQRAEVLRPVLAWLAGLSSGSSRTPAMFRCPRAADGTRHRSSGSRRAWDNFARTHRSPGFKIVEKAMAKVVVRLRRSRRHAATFQSGFRHAPS